MLNTCIMQLNHTILLHLYCIVSLYDIYIPIFNNEIGIVALYFLYVKIESNLYVYLFHLVNFLW